MRLGHRQPRRAGAATVRIHVRNLTQMFNSLDPSPFWDRDLDRAAAEFIEEEFSERLASHPWHLQVYTHEGLELTADLQAALEHFYQRLASSARRRLRDQMRIGRLALLGGIGIFALSIGARGVLHGVLASVPQMLDEGLIVLAWIALWRPIEELVYEWVPLYRKRRLYSRLAAIRVTVRASSDSSTVPHMHTAVPEVADPVSS